MTFWSVVWFIVAVIEAMYIVVLWRGNAINSVAASQEADKDILGLRQLIAKWRSKT
jgi:hypothetical protein